MKKIILVIAANAFALLCFGQHTVVMKSGEKMVGQVTSVQNGVVTFQFKGNPMKLNVSEMTAIYFDGDAAAAPKTVSTASEPGEKTVLSGPYLVKYKVADRNITKAPKIDNLTQEKGTVEVDITVDKYGHVIKAVAGGKGSTTQSDYLLKKAKQAAESTMFDTFSTTPLSQTGYMIIVF